MMTESIITEVRSVDLPVTRYFATALSNLSAAYDKYRKVYDKSLLPLSSFPDRFFTTDIAGIEVGIAKAGKLSARTGKRGDRPIVIETTADPAELRTDHETGIGAYWIGTTAGVAAIFDPSGSSDPANWRRMKLEDALAESLAVAAAHLHSWSDVRPRSLSWLPIGHACQASCPFCFSKASVSEDYRGKLARNMDLARIAEVARDRGAERAVITGGGEPTLLDARQLRDGIATLSRALGRTIMITNGHILGHRDRGKARDDVTSWSDAGLSVLAVSRHAAEDPAAERLMGLRVDTAAAIELAREAGIAPRLIAVLQRGGVEDGESLNDYLDWAVEHGVGEINFKELYVSTSLESNWADREANRFSEENSVPLSLVLDAAEAGGWQLLSRLPWGAPVYEAAHRGHRIKIAAYTEPSVHWERANGIARSWNIMADGTVMASLEDRDSRVDIDGL